MENKLETKNIIRNEDLKFLLQIELYFNKNITIKLGNIVQLIKEIQNIIEEIIFQLLKLKKEV